jgi:hypothetical protein
VDNRAKAFERTRLALHGAAEMLLAAPQYQRSGKIGLRIVPGGFATTRPPALSVTAGELIAGDRHFALAGTYREVVDAAELAGAGQLREVYSGSPDFSLDDPIDIDPMAAKKLIAGYEFGNAALVEFAPKLTPILWPEHFDIGITLEDVNYGVSPGDSGIDRPYAYVGPHTPRTGEFWNAPFGSARLLSHFADQAELVAYFRKGQRLAAG